MTLLLWPSDGWTVVRSSDDAARALRDRHYTTERPGGRTVGPPGRRLVLRTVAGDAAWISSYQRHVRDGLDAWRCTLFRNESARRSSELIAEAMAATRERWGEPPPDGWVTYVDPRKVAGTNPGYVFKLAGWTVDRVGGRDRHGPVYLVRLRAPG